MWQLFCLCFPNLGIASRSQSSSVTCVPREKCPVQKNTFIDSKHDTCECTHTDQLVQESCETFDIFGLLYREKCQPSLINKTGHHSPATAFVVWRIATDVDRSALCERVIGLA
uniref:Putative secreted protein n=1 Tax=Ixodes scapularis TaxID=6945 RepID=A0A4D5RV81_IXOSC